MPKRTRRSIGLVAVLSVVASFGAITASPASADPGDAGFASDDFSAGSLAGVWSVDDPRGDGTVELSGTGTSDAVLSLSVPGGVGHDAWTTNDSLAVTQAISNGDFSTEAKFDTAPTAKYQMQGLTAREDDANWIRADYYHDGSNLRFFVATFTNGSPTVRANVVVPNGSSLWIRLARSGNNWTASTSTDGSGFTGRAAFSWNLNANEMGVFAGNALGSSSPAFTAEVDYIFNTNSPINPEDPEGTTPTTTTTTEPTGTTTTTPGSTTTTTAPTTTTTAPTTTTTAPTTTVPIAATKPASPTTTTTMVPSTTTTTVVAAEPANVAAEPTCLGTYWSPGHIPLPSASHGVVSVIGVTIDFLTSRVPESENVLFYGVDWVSPSSAVLWLRVGDLHYRVTAADLPWVTPSGVDKSRLQIAEFAICLGE